MGERGADEFDLDAIANVGHYLLQGAIQRFRSLLLTLFVGRVALPTLPRFQGVSVDHVLPRGSQRRVEHRGNGNHAGVTRCREVAIAAVDHHMMHRQIIQPRPINAQMQVHKAVDCRGCQGSFTKRRRQVVRLQQVLIGIPQRRVGDDRCGGDGLPRPKFHPHHAPLLHQNLVDGGYPGAIRRPIS